MLILSMLLNSLLIISFFLNNYYLKKTIKNFPGLSQMTVAAYHYKKLSHIFFWITLLLCFIAVIVNCATFYIFMFCNY